MLSHPATAATMAARALPLLLVLCPRPSAAWGPDGHTIVAHVADSLLSPEVEEVLRKDLGTTSLTDASTWCDDFDHSPAGKWSESLHYINYPGHTCAFSWDRDCKHDWCNAGAIVNYTKQIFDTSSSSETRLVALKFVIHMAGDLHQPLHVASEGDRGGNDIHVKYDFKSAGAEAKGSRKGSREGNLHAIWDAAIVVQDISEIEQAANLPPTADWQKLSESLKQRLKGDWSSDLTQWEQDVASQGQEDALRAGLTKVGGETATLGCKYAYIHSDGKPVQSGESLGRDYYTRVKPIVEMQLARGGARLAQLLKDALRAAQLSRSSSSTGISSLLI